MNAAIKAIAATGEWGLLNAIPINILDQGKENECIEFVNKYKQTYGDFPVLERIEQEFPDLKAIRFNAALPTRDIVDQWVKKRKAMISSRMLEDVAERINDGDEVDLMNEFTKINQIAKSGKREHIGTSKVTLEDVIFPEGSMMLNIQAFDEKMKGVLPGETTVIAARPNIGKTIFMIWMCYNWYLQGKKILFLSCEMQPKIVMQRFVAIINGFNPNAFRQWATLTQSERDQITLMVDELNTKTGVGEIIVPKDTIFNIGEISPLIEEYKPDILVIDAFYNMSSGNQNDDFYGSIGSTSRQLSQLSLHYGIYTFLTSQINRGNGKTDDILSRLAFSDAIAQSADHILYMQEDPDKSGARQVEIAKTRSEGKHTLAHFLVDVGNLRFEEEYAPII